MGNRDKFGRFMHGNNIFKKKGIYKHCLICNKEFYVIPCQFKTSKYCSQECHWKSKIGVPSKKRLRFDIICNFCQKHFEKIKANIKERNFCSRECLNKSMVGNERKKRKDGRYISKQGYVYIYQPKHPSKCANNYMKEHRYIMEQSIGRHLLPEEVVHHINKIRHDNRIENLMLLPSKSAHRKLHAQLNKK